MHMLNDQADTSHWIAIVLSAQAWGVTDSQFQSLPSPAVHEAVTPELLPTPLGS